MIKLFCFAPGLVNREAGGSAGCVARGRSHVAVVVALCFAEDGSDAWPGSSVSACRAATEAFPNPQGEKNQSMKLPGFAVWFCNIGKSNRESTECWSHALAGGKDRPGCS